MKKITKPDLFSWWQNLPPAMRSTAYLSKRITKNGEITICVCIKQSSGGIAVIGVVSNNVFQWFTTVQNKTFDVFIMKIFAYRETQFTIIQKKSAKNLIIK